MKAGGVKRPPPDDDVKDETITLRRTSRQVKRRIIMVGNVPVLKLNNYDLESGEQSVFQQELLRKKSGGALAVADKNAGSRLVQHTVQARQVKQPRAQQAAKPVNAAEQARHSHNASVREDARATEGSRAVFLARHLKVLRPFITAAAAEGIRTRAAKAGVVDVKPDVLEFQPACVKGQMREYQLEGLRWLVQCHDHGVNAILADEMGLGKTLQTISFLAYLQFVRGVKGPSLVVVPLSVMSSWLTEFKKWAPEMRVVRFHANDKDERLRLRKEVLADPSSFDVAVTTYDMMLSQHFGNALCHTICWRYLVLDEGHKIKNEHTNVANVMRHVSRHGTLLLTGTPIANNLHELYALLSFLYPEVFTDPVAFDNAFDLVKHKVDNAKLEQAHLLLRPFCLRRLKEDVEKSLPPRVETRIQCPLSEMQNFWYRRLLLKDSVVLREVEAEASGIKYEKDSNDWRKLQLIVMQLRKCCNHPYLFPGAEPDFDGETTGEDIIAACGKMQVLDRMLAKLKGRGHRVVLFSQLNMMLDIIEDFLIMRGYKYVRLDGSTNRVQRMIDIAMFNKENSDVFIYILNTRAGGLGVNLQTADTCILYDSDWNPQWDLQAMARVHRIGQTKPVHVYRFCTTGTVEERVQQRAEKKLYLDQMVNRGSVAEDADMEGLTKQELLSMLQFGADRIFASKEGRPPSNAELDAILDRSSMLASTAAKKPGLAVVKADSTEAGVPEAAPAPALDGLVSSRHNAASFAAEEQPLSTLVLNGVDYSAARSIKDIGSEFWGGRQRERKQRLMTIDGHDVLRVNNYSLEQGEPSVFEWEGKHIKAAIAKPKAQRAGRDYDWSELCQVCFDGGSLVCCDMCPAAYHPKCIGLTMKEIEKQTIWSCPHHYCATCERKTQAAGGLLFRCQGCETAMCEDCLPGDADIIGNCPRFQALGQIHPKQACFMHCSAECKAYTESMPELFAPKSAKGGSRKGSL